MSARRLTSVLLLVPGLVAGTLTLAPPGALASQPGTAPSATVTVAGAPATAVGAGDTMTLTQTAPADAVGQNAQALEATWDPAEATLDTAGATQPEGWPLEYTVDGTSWTSTAPTDLGTVSGVRTSGALTGNGFSDDLQVTTTTGSGTLKPAAASFSGSSGGDGWDVFFTSTKVLNVWHHNSWTYNLDCHLRAGGSSCGDVYSVAGYQTGHGSSGTAVGDRVYSSVVESETSTSGILCTDTGTAPFTSCGFTPLASGAGSYDVLGTQSRAGNRVYVPVDVGGGQLTCFDTATDTACPGQPYALPGFSAVSYIPAYSVADGGKVFVTASQVWCFDAATGAACEGTWPAGSYGGFMHAAVPSRATDGTLTGVCLIQPAGDCFDLTGAATPMPAALADLLSARPVGGYVEYGYGQYGFTSTRQYWFTGSVFDYVTPTCWDWATGSACDGFSTSTPIEMLRYSIVVDPADSTCLWSNGDNGQIAPFDGLTGEPGCRPSDPTVTIPYTTSVPRLSCAEAGRVRAWQSVTVNPPAGLATSDLRVTIRTEDGTPLAGWSDISPDTAGRIDLSTLSVSTSGTRPSMEVRAVGGTDEQAAAITASVRYVADPAQLCVQLVSRPDCPTLRAVYPTPEIPLVDLTVDGTATTTTDEGTTSTPLPVQVSRAPLGGCLGAVTGTVSRSGGSTSVPLPGSTVQLLDPANAVLATATTDPSGEYAFANVVPATYTVRALQQDAPVTITAGGTAVADLTVTVPAPTARPVHGSTLQNSPATLAIDATADPVTSIDRTTVELRDGGAWADSLDVPGQGRWEVVAGDLRFTPDVGFTGASDQVTYSVQDGFGVRASSTADVDVSAVLPTAAPTAAAGVQGDTLHLLPQGGAGTVALDPTGTMLVSQSGAASTSLRVPGTGTYQADPATGGITFTPEGAFVGGHTVVYRVRDVTGRTADSVATVTLSPITLAGGPVQVVAGSTASVPVTGIPASSTVSVDPVEGAAATGVQDGVLTVTPAAGFSGTLTVPVTVVHGSATVVHQVVVRVLPAASRTASTGLEKGGSRVRWTASPTGTVTTYRVYTRGRLVCTTTATSCHVDRLLGPRSKVTVVAVGGSALASAATPAKYRFRACIIVTSVHFASASAELTRAARRTVAHVKATLRNKGFRHVCLVGHTDSRGSVASNTRLSAQRASAVAHRMRGHLSVKVSTKYVGEKDPAHGNGSAAGRADNRRVTVAIG